MGVVARVWGVLHGYDVVWVHCRCVSLTGGSKHSKVVVSDGLRDLNRLSNLWENTTPKWKL